MVKVSVPRPEPPALVADRPTATGIAVATEAVPEIRPVAGFKTRPVGKPVAPKLVAPFVAVI
jgi:hypothetical protein